ncbi:MULTISPECIES: DUF5677 domain-containing protein [unclassified Bacillus (in: firmicutes)]|uniref:DUF5677 domain-containing protein n=1 Tax=unclassified Bacillus (in: firmicutes) TaxID=185979 RepID=UPI001BEB7FA3|nr:MULTISPECIES: DUF5677 domain-containing protein [unclassified Bacillus (in: firmicutes)]MBT2614436.1 hypothetical protein [Bacillus sp. ISL-78]MBT2628509.1 hypothetical protein [Bacillus sp. ISL-101]
MSLFEEIQNTNIEDSTDYPNLNTLSKSIQAGQQILELSASKENLKHHDVIIISIYRKVLEQADGLFILLDHDSNSAARSTFRTLYETSIGMQFIFEKENLLENRANSYYVSYMHEQLTWAKEAMKTEELSGIYTKEELKEKVAKFKSSLSYEPLKSVNKAWHKEKAKLERKNKHFPPKWYSLYEGAGNFTHLASRFEATHRLLYAGYSLETHGFTALQNIVNDEGTKKQLLTPLRNCHSGYDTLCQLGRSILNLCSSLMVIRYCPEVKHEFSEFLDSGDQ